MVRSGPFAIAGGLGLLGLSSYVFLLVSGRELGDAAYAPLGSLWVLIFLIAPAFFFPIEQEVSRAVAARRARNEGVKPVFERAVVMALCICVVLVLVVLATSPLYMKQLFNNHVVLLMAMLIAFVTFAAEYCLKGLLAGSGRLRAYGLLLSVEGFTRAGAAVLFVFGDVTSASPYALMIGIACLAAVLVVAPGKSSLLQDGPHSAWKELSVSLGSLIVASLFSQALTNAAPLVVKYFAGASEQERAGAFIKAVVITRIPIFLFQAVQAVLLPRLTHHATTGQRQEFDKTLRLALGVVAGIGAAGCLGALLLGPELLTLFGSNYGFSRSDVVLLAAGNALLLLCLTLAQGLISVHRQSRTVTGWGVGLVAFLAAYALPGSIVTRSELALVIGAGVAMITLFALLRNAPLGQRME